MTLLRLQKILAQAGVASRRAAEQYIVDGRVRVNDKVVRTLGAKADASKDTISVDGWGTLAPEPLVYIVLNKPEGVLTTVSDPEGRHTVLDVLARTRAVGPRRFEGALPRVFPVGRLDFDAQGLVLLTNDGELAQRLLHPRYHVPKTYLVKVRGRPDSKALTRLAHGVRLPHEDGRPGPRSAPAQVDVVQESPSNTWLSLVIREGRHHQVKRMCQAIGHHVIRIVRTGFGATEPSTLDSGAWRFLSDAEVRALSAPQHSAPARLTQPRRRANKPAHARRR
ncbi:MAG: rRNA pseudouridine synthase, partial [Deltaproteobacteria bacterium]|nr:rRNA pseudouridine synthase [Deltaproteobacteria bacterium]